MAAKKSVEKKTIITEVVEKKHSVKKRKSSPKKAHKPHKSESDIRIEKALVDNFVSLQKIMVNFYSKFDELSSQISKLLNLFEISAKTLAEKEFVAEQDKKDNKDIIKKMEDIIDQNKTIARGITLMHDLVTGEESSAPRFTPPATPQMIKPRMPPQMPRPVQSQRPESSELYQKSIYSKEDELKNSN